MSGKVESVKLGSYLAAVEDAIADIKRNRIIERIWAKDYTVWKPSPHEIANRLGWLTSPEEMLNKLEEIDDLVNSVRAGGYSKALLLGMGGSSLAPEIFRKVFGVKEGYLDLAIVDSTDPGALLAHAESLDLKKTLFIVSTKSGGTVETFSFLKYFYNLVAESEGANKAGLHFIAITDPGSKLADIAQMYQFRRTFLNDPDIGGRYSALSYFGLVPAALIGVDTKALLQSAITFVEKESANEPGFLNGSFMGAIIGEMAKAGRDKLTFFFSPQIASFGDWLEQLIAESTGKEGKGIVPIVGEPIGEAGMYGNDRLFVHLRLNDDNDGREAMNFLEEAGNPAIRIVIDNFYDIAGQCYLWEMATAVAGYFLKINPFDQPDVEAAKVLARDMIISYMKNGQFPQEVPLNAVEGISVYGDIKSLRPQDALIDFLKQAKPGAYAAIQAYVQPTAEMDEALQLFRTGIRDKFGLATTVGYGPRFLHSTGQLHKGDGGKGLFIQLTADDERDAPIPDELGMSDSSITFGILKAAQAYGDRRALENAGRSVIRFHFETNAISGVNALAQSFSAGL